MIRQNQKPLNLIYIGIDFIILVTAQYLSFRMVLKSFFPIYNQVSVTTLVCVLNGLMHLLVYGFFHQYRSYRNTPFWIQLTELAKANLTAYLIQVITFYMMGVFMQLQVAITVFFFLSTALQGLYRAGMRAVLHLIREKGFNRKFLLLLGVNACTETFADKVESSPGFGYEIIGYVAEKKAPDCSLPYLGPYEKLESLLKTRTIDEVFLMLREEEAVEFDRRMVLLEKYGVKFSIIPQLFAFLPSRVYVTSFDDLPILGMRRIPLDGLFNSIVKRSFDLLVSCICLLVFSPIMAVAAIAVKVSSPGPVIFRQTRVGSNRKPFQMYKFRSMRVETESVVKMAGARDERCTPVGAFLRKYSIDELPQLVNVLKGDMSLVGPRPEIPHFVNQFMQNIPAYMIKHYVRPGMTGLAQIRGLRGGDTSIQERIRCDIEYIENWSLWLDLRILWKTAFRLRADRGVKQE